MGRTTYSPLSRAQPEALELAGGGARQRVDELDPRGYLYGAMRLDEVLDRLGLGVPDRGVGYRAQPSRSTTNAVTRLPARLVGHPDDAALEHVGVRWERLLDLRTGDVVAGRDDHVVAAGLVPEVAVVVADEGVTGDVPAVLDVAALPLVGEVAASGRALDRQPARLPVGHVAAERIEDWPRIAGHGTTGGAGPDVVVGGGDEDVQHLGGADAVDERDAGGVAERVPGRDRQVLTGRHGAPQRAELVALGRTASIARYAVGAVKQMVAPVLGDQVGELVRGGLLDEQRATRRPGAGRRRARRGRR